MCMWEPNGWRLVTTSYFLERNRRKGPMEWCGSLMLLSWVDWRANWLLMLWSVWSRVVTFTGPPLTFFRAIRLHRTLLLGSWPFMRWWYKAFRCCWFLSFSTRCCSSQGCVFSRSPFFCLSSSSFCHYMSEVDDHANNPTVFLFLLPKAGEQ